jgi:carbon monoxide dehydrogenase subunit G
VSVLTSSIEIPAPPEKVWEAVSDLEVYGRWMTLHAGFPAGSPGRMEPGMRYKEKVKVMGMPGDVDWTVAELEEPSSVRLHGEGPMGIQLRAAFLLESEGEGTRVSYESEFGGAALVALQSVVEKEAQKAGDESLQRLRDLVAGGSPVSP